MMAMAIGSGNKRIVGRRQEAIGGIPAITGKKPFLSF
jgi:hypothetical protein